MLRKIFISSAFAVLLCSCVPAKPGIDYAGPSGHGKTIAILPFGLDSSNEDLVVPPGVTTKFNYKLHENLFNALKTNVVTDINKSYEILRKYESYDNNLAVFSKQSGADLILTGFISNYSERVGGELGVESPAAVSFLARLYDAKTGELLWQYFYTEQQSPLFENLAEVGKFFKRKGKWVSAWELTEEGINVVVNRLQNLLEPNANNTGN
ncbi:MAG: hypothetical protein GWO07_03630 [Candidatus Dadabacteria bacterium]|nr:hypothetical protein [Candidatus Dadabacteria bacterium]NIS07855.1 hypothetical protein [Candidatus Dadabacteria bacterium]NIV42827.1 hypothetical protein [Candidatus Dadabacteria bacterium]NIY21643.1 hypothetical protein [Candidatus Dadabacteria bacterium]